MDSEIVKVGVGAIIIKDGLMLLAKRKGSFAAGTYGSVGGHLKFGESPIDGVKREAREELGIEIENLVFATCTSINRYGKHYIDISFTASISKGEPKICEPEKIETIGWFPIDNPPSPLFGIIEIYLTSLKTGQKYFEVHE